jgi:broad specificity phosphatase PhoE
MIYFIRHGETAYNRQGRVQGHLDIPLNEKGISQAEKARDDFKNVDIDLIYCSPLQRARETAEIINEFHGVEVVIDERLIELHMGSVQGKTIDECSAEELEVAFENPEKNGGESLKDLCERVVAVYEEVEKLNKNVLIVAHGAVYRALYRYLNNIEGYALDVDTPPNATIIELKKAR